MENVGFVCNVCQHSWNDDPMEVNECPNCGSDDFNQSGGGGFLKKNLKKIIIGLSAILLIVLGLKFCNREVEKINAVVKCEKNKLVIEITGNKNKLLDNADFEFSVSEKGRYLPITKFNCVKIKEKEKVYVRAINNNEVKASHKIRWSRINCCSMLDEDDDDCDVTLMMLQDPLFNCPNLQIIVDNAEGCSLSYSLNGSAKQKSNSFKANTNDKKVKVAIYDDKGVLIAEKQVDNECYEAPACDEAKVKASTVKLIKKLFANPDDSNLASSVMKSFTSPSKKIVKSNNGNESIQDLITYVQNEYIFAGSVFSPSISLKINPSKCKIESAQITW